MPRTGHLHVGAQDPTVGEAHHHVLAPGHALVHQIAEVRVQFGGAAGEVLPLGWAWPQFGSLAKLFLLITTVVPKKYR